MKKNLLVCIPIVAILTNSSPADASTIVKVYKNCTEMHRDYPGGVAKPGAVNKGGTLKGKVTYNLALYQANLKSDRDKDGLACEK